MSQTLYLYSTYIRVKPSTSVDGGVGRKEVHVWYLHGSAGRGADERSGSHGRGCCQAPLPLLLVDPVPLGLGQLQEVLHGAKVDQQRLGRSFRVLLLTQNLGEQTLRGWWGGGRGGRATSVRRWDGERTRLLLRIRTILNAPFGSHSDQ